MEVRVRDEQKLREADFRVKKRGGYWLFRDGVVVKFREFSDNLASRRTKRK